jgi:hypothetical protein
VGAWTGWVGDMLDGLAIPHTPENRTFLQDWHLYNEYDCHNNPLLASHGATGASACHKLNNLNTARSYATHASAVTATRQQLNSGAYPNLHDALHSGNALDYNLRDGVEADLVKWGSVRWANQLRGSTTAPPPSGPGKRPHAMGAWTRWMHALAHTGPQSHARVVKATRRANRIARHR